MQKVWKFLGQPFFSFCSQPKDTQQALSRKASAVNMEKFKKFAARRKWKVSHSITHQNVGDIQMQ